MNRAIGQSTWGDSPFTLEKNPGLPMQTYIPVLTDGSGAVIPESAFTNGAPVTPYFIAANRITILFGFEVKLPAMADTTFLELSLPPEVTDVIIPNPDGHIFMIGHSRARTPAAYRPFEVEIFDGYPFVDLVPVYSVDGVTDAVTSDAAATFDVDPLISLFGTGPVTFQFE